MAKRARLVSPCTRAPTPRAREMRVATLSALVGGRPGRARCRVASYTARSQRRARVSTCPSDDGPSTDWIGRAAGMARRPRPEAAEAPRETRPKWAECDPSSRLRRIKFLKPRGAATGRRPNAFGAVYVDFIPREGPQPTPPSRDGRVTADFQPSVHLLGFGVLDSLAQQFVSLTRV